MHRAAAVVILALQATAGHARPEAAVCSTQRSTVEMVDCLRFLLDRVDGDMAAVVAQTARYYPSYIAPLLAAQRHWQAYRDAQCLFMVALDEGGSIAPLNALGCRLAMTRQRIEELTATWHP